MGGAHLQSFFRDQSDNLASFNFGPLLFRLAPHGLKNDVQRSALEIRQIHGNLRPVPGLEIDSHRLYAGQASGRLPDFASDRLGHRDIGSSEIDVVSDQKLASPDYGRPGCGMQAGAADVGPARGISQYFLAQSFELAPPNVFELHALRPFGRSFVIVHRNAAAPPDFLTHLPGQFHALL